MSQLHATIAIVHLPVFTSVPLDKCAPGTVQLSMFRHLTRAKRIAPAAQKELLIGLRARTASVVISYNAAQAKVPLLVVKGLCSTYGTNSDRMRKKG